MVRIGFFQYSDKGSNPLEMKEYSETVSRWLWESKIVSSNLAVLNF